MNEYPEVELRGPSLSSGMTFVLKFILSDISIAVPASLKFPFA